MATDPNDLWFSKKQLDLRDTQGLPRLIGRNVTTGELSEYTEMIPVDSGKSNWDDVVYLGVGYYDHTIVVSKE